MAYQLTPLTQIPGATLALSGGDDSFWSVANGALYWYDGCAWQAFAAPGADVVSLAVVDLKNIWAIVGSDPNIYNFNGIGWTPANLPAGGGRCLSAGFDGQLWCLDDASRPQVWRFDSESGTWSRFGKPAGKDPDLVEISSGGAGGGEIFLAALDTAGTAWRCTDASGTWTKIPVGTQVVGKSIAAGPDGAVFIADSPAGLLWQWREGDPFWIRLSEQPGTTRVSVRADGRLLAVDGHVISGAIESSPSLKGFRGSDWNNAGTRIFAVIRDEAAGCDKIYRSRDGIVFEAKACGQLPPIAVADYYWYTTTLMIPTVEDGGPESMLVAPLGLQSIYLCADIGQDVLRFEPVFTDGDDPGRSGVFNGFAEDADGNVYAGWYAIDSPKNKAILYRSTRAENYRTWTPIAKWQARHIHTVSVNPSNGFLYVVIGEPRGSGATLDSADTARIMRSKDGGASWTCVTDTWSSTPVMPSVPGAAGLYLGLYFAALGFIGERVVIGEDTDFKPGRIFYFDDDGRDAGDPARPLPFVPQATYRTCNDGEFFANAVTLGKTLYFTSLFLDHTPGITSTRCVSTTDGVSWRVEQICSYLGAPLTDYNATLGILTKHPDRGHALIYSLSAEHSFIVADPSVPAEERSWPKRCRLLEWLERLTGRRSRSSG